MDGGFHRDVRGFGSLTSVTAGRDRLEELTTSNQLEALARWVGNLLSYQLAPAICPLNYGDDGECPVIVPNFVVPEDPMTRVQRLTVVAQLVPLSKTCLAEQLGVPVEEGTEKVTTKDTNDMKWNRRGTQIDADWGPSPSAFIRVHLRFQPNDREKHGNTRKGTRKHEYEPSALSRCAPTTVESIGAEHGSRWHAPGRRGEPERAVPVCVTGLGESRLRVARRQPGSPPRVESVGLTNSPNLKGLGA